MSKCLVGPKFITEVNGETGPSINLTPDKVGGLSEYTCTTSEGNHALVGQGDNIKFIADANYSEGNTITVNGKTVTAKLQNGEPLSSDAWVAGAVVTCYLNGDVLNFKGGGGLSAADKAKLIPGNIREGVTFFGETPREVVGALYTGFPLSAQSGDSVTCGGRGFIKTNDEKTVFSCYRWASSPYVGWVVIGLTETSVQGNAASSANNVQYYSAEYDETTLYFAQLSNNFVMGDAAVATIGGKQVRVAVWEGSNSAQALANVDEVLRTAKAILTA